jgi:RND superfamily putative drug exporter
LALVALIGPTQLMVSVGAGALTCAAFATGGAVVVMPAALVLLGRRIDAFSFPAPAPLVRLWSGLVSGGNWITRHAVYSGFAATVLLALIAVPALALRSGPESISQLPAGSKARIAYNEISRVMGPGYATPYNLVVVANNRPITTPALLTSVYGLEQQIARNRNVYSVTGPGAINPVSTQLKSFGPGLRHSVKLSDQSKKDLLKLANGLGEAGAGSGQLQAGLAAASSGASKLHAGGGKAQSGAAQLHAGLAQIHAGSAQLSAGLNKALAGVAALKNGSNQLATGAKKLATGAKPVVPALNMLAGSAATTSSQVNSALAELQSMTTGKNDAHYSATLSALTAASSSATATKSLSATVASQAPALVNGINQLTAGIVKLQNGNALLAAQFPKLTAGGAQLTSVLSQATAGAGALQIGLGQLATGAGQLATGLSSGVAPAGTLTTGLGTMQAAVTKSRGQIPSTAQLKQLLSQSPGMFNSGYFVLAAVEGSTRANRLAATFTINLLNGGTAGQIMVVSKYASNDLRTEALGTTLDKLGAQFARRNHVQIAVGGPEGSLGDLTHVTKSRIWLDVAVLSAAIVLVLALALRAVLLPAVATAFSLLVAASTFGLLQLLFGGSNPPLGGPGYLDPITIISVFTIAFGITVVFSTVLLMRTREAYVAAPTAGEAVRVGLRETAAAGTGAGLVMVAALIPFAITDLLNIQALGIGVAFAVLLDVLIVRPVLLPAAEAVLGRYGWWPTAAPSPSEAAPPTDTARRLQRLPRRRPSPVER